LLDQATVTAGAERAAAGSTREERVKLEELVTDGKVVSRDGCDAVADDVGSVEALDSESDEDKASELLTVLAPFAAAAARSKVLLSPLILSSQKELSLLVNIAAVGLILVVAVDDCLGTEVVAVEAVEGNFTLPLLRPPPLVGRVLTVLLVPLLDGRVTPAPGTRGNTTLSLALAGTPPLLMLTALRSLPLPLTRVGEIKLVVGAVTLSLATEEGGRGT